MEILQLNKKILVISSQVKSFPSGITEAFDSLASFIENPAQRAWFGIGSFDEKTRSYTMPPTGKQDQEKLKNMVYNATTSTMEPGLLKP